MTKHGNCRARIEQVDTSASPEAVAAITASQAEPAILETLQPASIAGRFSIFASEPLETIVDSSAGEHFFQGLDHRFSQLPTLQSESHLPFCGGWIGHVSYEVGATSRFVQPRRDSPEFPLLRFGLYDHALVLDHQSGTWYATAIDWEDCVAGRATASDRLESLRRRLQTASQLRISEPAVPGQCEIQEALSPRQYRTCVHRIIEYIEAGDIYQANLAQRFRLKTELSPFDCYRRVRDLNPSTFAAYLSWENAAIISASPELFLQLRGGHAVTRPIKGTRPRCGIHSLDHGFREELARSPKEQSELNMIIDLLRNDFGRVCEYGSIRVADCGSIEEHPTVFHRVATIEGRLAEGRGWRDLLESAFPGGSIVGAPKIRAMQIIREIEPFGRGPYCGAIGWIGLDGNMTLSIAIRTMVWHDRTVDVFAGGAIVAESDAEAEYEEILAKAGGLFRCLNASAKTTRTMLTEKANVV